MPFILRELLPLFCYVGLLLIAANIFGFIAECCKQPAVIGELLVGIVLGPTVFGRYAPALHEQIFPTLGPTPATFDLISKIAVTVFLFAAGMKVDLRQIWRHRKTAALVSSAGLILPFAIGFGLCMRLPEFFNHSAQIQPQVLSLFVGTALAISALPVIVRILMDLNLYHTNVGTVIVTSALLSDLIGWIVFGWLLHKIGNGQMAIHPSVGAFIVGALVGSLLKLRHNLKEGLEQFSSTLFAPLFFAGIGLKVDFVGHFDLRLVILITGVAILSKLIGCTLGALASGMKKGEALAVGFGLNARGAIEIVLALIALQAGLIDERLFVALVVMAILTSMLSAAMIRRALRWT